MCHLPVEGAYRYDGLRNILPIGAYILHGRAAHRAGNAGEALAPRIVRGDGIGDQPVPVFSGRGGAERTAILLGRNDAVGNIVFAGRFRKPAGGAANLKGGIGGERYFLEELHFPSRYIRRDNKTYPLAKVGATLYNQ